MPAIDSLMQTWNCEFEQNLSKLQLEDPRIPIPLNLMVQMICNICDIPLTKDKNKNYIESLHVLFSLYASFQQNDHFYQKNSSMNTTNNFQRLEFN